MDSGTLICQTSTISPQGKDYTPLTYVVLYVCNVYAQCIVLTTAVLCVVVNPVL